MTWAPEQGALDAIVDDTVHGALQRFAEDRPDKPALTLTDGRVLSAARLLEESRRFAAALQSRGVAPGDRVVVQLENCEEFVTSFFGCALAGAVIAPLNLAWKGPILEYGLQDAGPKVVLADTASIQHIEAAIGTAPMVEHLVLVGGAESGHPAASAYPEFVSGAGQPQPVDVRPRDLLMILYTSGTTGPSKGIMYCHRMTLTFANGVADTNGLTSDDVYFSCLPLFHANALLATVLGCVMRQASAVLAPRFSVTDYWRQIHDSGATVSSLVGSMTPLLWRNESDPLERDHPPLTVFVGPAPTDDYYFDFEKRFNVRFVSAYGLTDVGVITSAGVGGGRAATTGRLRPEWEVMIVDDDNNEVPPDTVGEMIVRPKHPYITALGYWRKPEASVEAWQNLWYHTGDYLRVDQEGWYYFVDRKKDAIRRGGENISSSEVEAVVASHDDVAEVAVFAVPSELSEDDVMAAIVLREGSQASPEQLHEYFLDNLPHFAVPRYIDVRRSLPRTPTEKIRKAVLRESGITASTWDAGPRTRRR